MKIRLSAFGTLFGDMDVPNLESEIKLYQTTSLNGPILIGTFRFHTYDVTDTPMYMLESVTNLEPLDADLFNSRFDLVSSSLPEVATSRRIRLR